MIVCIYALIDTAGMTGIGADKGLERSELG
jgi:hypothetical protein